MGHQPHKQGLWLLIPCYIWRDSFNQTFDGCGVGVMHVEGYQSRLQAALGKCHMRMESAPMRGASCRCLAVAALSMQVCTSGLLCVGERDALGIRLLQLQPFCISCRNLASCTKCRHVVLKPSVCQQVFGLLQQP
jgi:hypothetical protein